MTGSQSEFRGDVRGYIHRAENNGPVIAYSENTFLNFILCCHEVGRVHGRSVQSLVTQILEAVKATGHRVSATEQSEKSVPSISTETQSHPYIKENGDEQHLSRSPSDTSLNPPPPITDKPTLEKKLLQLSPEMLIYLISLGGNPFDDLEKFYPAISSDNGTSDVTTLLGAYPTLSPGMKQYITDLSSKPRRAVICS